jgi:hypothetical protein
MNLTWASLIMEELVRTGVRQICIAPGSRSSPLAVAAVKGTSFDVVHDAVSGTLVKVFEGLVSVLDLDGGGSVGTDPGAEISRSASE